jgi:hypothetical protein
VAQFAPRILLHHAVSGVLAAAVNAQDAHASGVYNRRQALGVSLQDWRFSPRAAKK